MYLINFYASLNVHTILARVSNEFLCTSQEIRKFHVIEDCI